MVLIKRDYESPLPSSRRSSRSPSAITSVGIRAAALDLQTYRILQRSHYVGLKNITKCYCGDVDHGLFWQETYNLMKMRKEAKMQKETAWHYVGVKHRSRCEYGNEAHGVYWQEQYERSLKEKELKEKEELKRKQQEEQLLKEQEKQRASESVSPPRKYFAAAKSTQKDSHVADPKFAAAKIFRDRENASVQFSNSFDFNVHAKEKEIIPIIPSAPLLSRPSFLSGPIKEEHNQMEVPKGHVSNLDPCLVEVLDVVNGKQNFQGTLEPSNAIDHPETVDVLKLKLRKPEGEFKRLVFDPGGRLGQLDSRSNPLQEGEYDENPKRSNFILGDLYLDRRRTKLEQRKSGHGGPNWRII